MTYACLHESTEIRRRSAALIGRQCIECGRLVGSWLKHSDVDAAALPAWHEEVQEELTNVVRLTGVRDVRLGRPTRPDDYSEYLGSAIWKRRRDKVMQRADGLCEGCLSQPAEDVHHLTYAHLYEEFAFELVALCRQCHERVHDLEQKRREAMA